MAGNVLANGGLHASNQGWGPWEVNISKVFDAPPPSPPNPANQPPVEWQNLLLGNPSSGAPSSHTAATGRAGCRRPPSPAAARWRTSTPRRIGTALSTSPAPGGSVTGTGTGAYTLPVAAGGYFPTFDPNAYLNGTMPEHTNSGGQFNHPMYFNPMFPTAGNRVFNVNTAFAGLLWAGVNALPNDDLRVRAPPTSSRSTRPPQRPVASTNRRC